MKRRPTSSLLLLIALLAICPMLFAAQVTASLDRSTVHLGETLTLSVTRSGSGAVTAPNFDALKGDFDVLQTSRSQSVNIINGQASRSMVWGAALRPTHTGTIVIPSLAVGGAKTRALTVTVLPASAAAQGGPGDDVFLEANIEPGTVYVGQQALYTVRLFYAGRLAQGDLDVPHADAADVQQLGKGRRYQAQRGGRTYQVIERRYAVIPQHVGTLTLPGIGFQGHIGLGGGFSGFFNTGRKVTARSPATHLRVKAKPVSAAAGPWLPARHVTLTISGLPADGKARVGEPLNLTLTEKATGVPFENLPKLTLPDIAGAQVYPDQPITTTSNDGQWLLGMRQRAFAIVPTRAGTLTIAPITLHWWNVETDQPETANVPAHTVQVRAAAGVAMASAPASAEPAAVTSTAAAPVAALATPAPASVPVHGWRWVAGALLALWLLTLLAWWWRRRRRAQPASTAAAPTAVSVRQARTAFRQSAAQSDAAAISHALLAWAHLERPQLHHLGELAAALDAEDQRAAIARLERSRYADHAAPIDGNATAAAFAGGFHWRPAQSGTPRDDTLPPLYPFERDE